MNIAVCVKQIPDPAVPGKLEADHTLDRSGKLILDDSDAYGVEMALQLAEKAGGGEVVLISMAPNGEVSGLRTALAMGAARAVLVSDDALAGLRRALHGQGAREGDRARGWRRPRRRRDRVDRRLHRHDPRADRGAARLAVVDVRQARRDRRRQGHHPAPDRSGLRRRRGAAAGGRERDRGCGRAAVPLVQGDHGGEEQAGRHRHRRRPRPRRRRRRLGRRAPDRSRRSSAAPEREAGEKIEDDGEAFQRVVAYLEQLKVI